MKRKLILIALLLAITVNIVSCDEIENIIDPYIKETETETETETEEVTETVTQAEGPKYFDPITAEPTERDLSTSRPIAVVVKNDRKAAPQYGLTNAAVIYEALVEGGMTRFLAVYSDASLVKKVGPVIDSRAYFFDFAANHNAVLAQAGSTANGNSVMSARGIKVLDAISGEMSPGFYRDELLNTARGYENSVVTEENGLGARASQYGISLKVVNPVSPYTTLDYMKNREMNGKYCTYLSIPFSTNMTIEYTYSTLSNKYSRVQYDGPHIDAINGKQLSFTNIIILSIDHTVIDNTTGEMNISDSGTGTGYYVYGGSCIQIKWQRTDGTNPIRLFEEDGLTPLQVSSGNTYIAVVSPRTVGKIKFEKAAS